MICLLCHQVYQESQRFLSLLLLKPNPSSICPSCQSVFTEIGDRHCESCYRMGDEGVCQDCKLWESKGHQVSNRSLYHYNDGMKDYMAQYKFQGDFLLASVFAKEIRQVLKAYKDYTIVPVPLSPTGYQQRQFNQVTAILKVAGVTYHEYLAKKESDKQSQKSRQDRLAHASPFYLKSRDINLPEKVLIVDDIYTTGATIQGIFQLLRKHGVKEMKSLTLAR